MTFNGNDFYGLEDFDRQCDLDQDDYMEPLDITPSGTIADQIEALNLAFEEKEGEPAIIDFDMADYYSIAPHGGPIQW
jgi:hypothetical protein